MKEDIKQWMEFRADSYNTVMSELKRQIFDEEESFKSGVGINSHFDLPPVMLLEIIDNEVEMIYSYIDETPEMSSYHKDGLLSAVEDLEDFLSSVENNE